jgi:hypothetical protein
MNTKVGTEIQHWDCVALLLKPARHAKILAQRFGVSAATFL